MCLELVVGLARQAARRKSRVKRQAPQKSWFAATRRLSNAHDALKAHARLRMLILIAASFKGTVVPGCDPARARRAVGRR
jgi:hypothetical protein